MTDPQLPPPPGSLPPVPPAPAYGAAPVPPVPPAPGYAGAAVAAPQAAPPGAYQVPVGGYPVAAGTYAVPQPTERRSGMLGLLALIFALVAGVVSPIVVGFAAFEIGRRIPQGIDTVDPDFLSILSPARDQVLRAEISFWTGLVLGIAAIVIAILAIKRRQGRGTGIAALVITVLAPIIYFAVLIVAFSIGSAAGFIAYTA